MFSTRPAFFVFRRRYGEWLYSFLNEGQWKVLHSLFLNIYNKIVDTSYKIARITLPFMYCLIAFSFRLPWLCSPRKISAAEYRGGLFNQYRHFQVYFGWVISPSQRLYLCRTTQHRNKRTNTYVLSRIRTHFLSFQAIKTYTSCSAASGTGSVLTYPT
jgi:hypothetical protein